MYRPPSSRTILVADDTPSVRLVVARICAANGYRVIEATDAADALRLAGASLGAIDLLVTDVDMPGMSGLELATELRKLMPGLPVCLVSGRDLDSGALVDLERRGRTAFLTKPFDLAELLVVIRSLLEDRRVRENRREHAKQSKRYGDTSSVGLSR